MERWSIPIALFILFIAWWIFATAMHRWNGWRDTAHEVRADRDKWRREAEKATAMAEWLAGMMVDEDCICHDCKHIQSCPTAEMDDDRAWEYIVGCHIKAAAEAVKEATDD